MGRIIEEYFAGLAHLGGAGIGAIGKRIRRGCRPDVLRCGRFAAAARTALVARKIRQQTHALCVAARLRSCSAVCPSPFLNSF